MAPIEKKRNSQETEEDVKRRRVEEDVDEDDIEVGEDDDDEEFDEDELDFADMIEEGPAFSAEDFDGDIDEETLEKFCEAYEKFCEKIDGGMVITKVVSIRPIPTTVEEFNEKVTWMQMTKEAEDANQVVTDNLDELVAETEEAAEKIQPKENESEDDFEARFEKEIEAAMKKTIGQQVAVWDSAVADLEKAMEKEMSKDILCRFLLLTDTLFSNELHQVFSDESVYKQGVALVDRLAKGWEKLAAAEDAKSGLSAKLRQEITQMHKDQVHNLNDGDFMIEDDAVNFHKDTKFAPKLVN